MSAVLDTSARFAMLFRERGADIGLAASYGAPLGAIDLAEAATRVIETGYGLPRLRELLGATGLQMGLRLGLSALTADRAWAGLDVGVAVRVVR